jgi:hypothetical protein
MHTHLPSCLRPALLRGLAFLSLLILPACGGGGGGGPAPPPQFTIGGTISGLASGGTAVLQVNGGSNLSVTSNGSFSFPTPLTAGTSYNVTVSSAPPNQSCSIANGSGTVASAINNITVTCQTFYSVGGTVTGLNGTLVLRNNGGDDLTVTASGAFTFAARVASGASYAVTVRTQPTGQNCSVAGGTGTASANVTTVLVACTTTPSYTLGGRVTGLAGAGLALSVNAGTPLAVPAGATAFTFPTSLLSGTDYQVKVTAQPAGQACTVQNGRSFIQANVTNVDVACVAGTTSALAGVYAIQGTNDYLAFQADGTYVHATRRADAACGTNSGNGVEYGVYRWNASTGAFFFASAVADSNGSCGFFSGGAAAAGASGTLARTGTGASTVLTFTPATGPQRILQPVSNTAGALVGAWASNKSPDVLVFASDRFTLATTQTDPAGAVLISAGIDNRCYTATGTAGGIVTSSGTSGGCTGAVTTTGLAANFGSSESYALPDPNTLNLGSGQTAGTWLRLQPN